MKNTNMKMKQDRGGAIYEDFVCVCESVCEMGVRLT